MKRTVFIWAILSGAVLTSFSQTIDLTGIYDGKNSIKLSWNMVSYNSKTGYMLLKSTDGISWTEIAKERLLRIYGEDDLFFYNDKNYFTGKNIYRVRIYDVNNNTIALSPIIVVNTRIIKPTGGKVTANVNKPLQSTTRQKHSNYWSIYPNPATDFIKLIYKGQDDLKGVVNVQIQDISGRVLINFRSGSKYRTIEIPISHLQRGAYIIRVLVLNNLMMTEKFVKQ